MQRASSDPGVTCLVAHADGCHGLPDPFTDAWSHIRDVEDKFVAFVQHSRRWEKSRAEGCNSHFHQTSPQEEAAFSAALPENKQPAVCSDGNTQVDIWLFHYESDLGLLITWISQCKSVQLFCTFSPVKCGTVRDSSFEDDNLSGIFSESVIIICMNLFKTRNLFS